MALFQYGFYSSMAQNAGNLPPSQICSCSATKTMRGASPEARQPQTEARLVSTRKRAFSVMAPWLWNSISREAHLPLSRLSLKNFFIESIWKWSCVGGLWICSFYYLLLNKLPLKIWPTTHPDVLICLLGFLFFILLIYNINFIPKLVELCRWAFYELD